jgi:iron complex outermembrane receptor protein
VTGWRGAGLQAFYDRSNKGLDPFEVSTSTQKFNESFKAIISELYELGAKANFFNNKLSTSIALYQLDLKNVAVNANDISNPDLFIQQGENRSRGAVLKQMVTYFPILQ